MPPKGSKAKAPAKASTNGGKPSKAQKVEAPSTPSVKAEARGEPEEGSDGTPTPKPKATPRSSRKKVTVPEKKFNPLDMGPGDVAPVDVSFENETVNGKPLNLGGFGQDLRLRAQQPFKLVETVMIKDGPHAGCQAVIIAPSKPFPFLAFPTSIRARIYRYYFAPAGKVYGKIDITQNANGLSAKAYAGESKARLGLLCVNKEIVAEARPILYSFSMRFDKADTVLAFLTCAGEKVRQCISSVEIIQYSRATALPTMAMLSECKNIQRIHIVGGVGVNTSPEKAAKSFYAEAHRFLQILGQHRGNKFAGIDLLSFGSKCFTIKEDGDLVDWNDEDVEEFTDALKERLK